MFKTNAKTKTATTLTIDGMRLQLEYPQFMAECLTDRVPYVMPSREGGYLILAEYGNPCPTSKKDHAKSGCGHSGGCGDCSECKEDCQHKDKKKDPCKQSHRAGLEKNDEDKLIRFEVIKYSGFEEDGVTLIIEKRGVDGTIKQEWPVKTLAFQAMTGQELKDIVDQIQGVKDFLKGLGCIVAVPTISSNSCGGWNTGEWRCFNGKYYRSNKEGNCSNPPNDTWDCGSSIFDLLDLNCDFLKDCSGQRLENGTRVATCEDLKRFQEKLSDCNDKPVASRAVITCDSLDADVFCKTADGKITICLDWLCEQVGICQPDNLAPTAVITGASQAQSNTTTSLSGANSTDTDGTIVAYEWSQVSGPAVTIVDKTAPVTGIILPVVTADTDIVLKLCVKDNDGLDNCTNHTIKVSPNVVSCLDVEKVLPAGLNAVRNHNLDSFKADYQSNTNPYYGDYLNDWHQLWYYYSAYDFMHYFHSSWTDINAVRPNIAMPTSGGVAEIHPTNNPDTAVHLSQALTTPLKAGVEYMLIAKVGGGTVDPDFRHVNDLGKVFTVNGLESVSSAPAASPNDFSATVIELGAAPVTVQNTDWQKVAVTFTPSVDIATLALSCRQEPAFQTATGYVNMLVTDIFLAEKSLFVCP